jgi:FG-GAP-like repeat
MPIAESDTPGAILPSDPVLRSWFRTARQFQSVIATLLAAAVLVVLPARASADPFYADLDRDGIRDIVTIQRSPASGLQVWLSASGRQIHLPTRRPVLRVTVSDIDGDGHLDLIAADASAVHVWHRTSHGNLRRMRPRRPPLAPAVSQPTGIAQDPGERSAAVVTNGFFGPEADAADPGQLPALDCADAVPVPSHRPAGAETARLIHPRGPPAD